MQLLPQGLPVVHLLQHSVRGGGFCEGLACGGRGADAGGVAGLAGASTSTRSEAATNAGPKLVRSSHQPRAHPTTATVAPRGRNPMLSAVLAGWWRRVRTSRAWRVTSCSTSHGALAARPCASNRSTNIPSPIHISLRRPLIFPPCIRETDNARYQRENRNGKPASTAADTKKAGPHNGARPDRGKSLSCMYGGGGTRTPKGLRPPHFECGALPVRTTPPECRPRRQTSPPDPGRGRVDVPTTSFQSGRPDSNRGPLRPERSALPD